MKWGILRERELTVNKRLLFLETRNDRNQLGQNHEVNLDTIAKDLCAIVRPTFVVVQLYAAFVAHTN
jgi:hypothetical protein